MSKVCYICGYKTKENIEKCPQCGVLNQWVTNETEYELSCISKDETFIQAMLELKEKDPIEYQLKLNQFKLQQEQQKQAKEQARVVEQKSASNQRKCRYCGSASFTPVKRKWSPLTGFLTNKTDLVCNNCGKKVQWIDM